MNMKQKGVVLLGALAIGWVVAAVGMFDTAAVVSNNDTTEVVDK